MSQAQHLVAEIRAYCEAHADAKQVDRYRRYFKEGYDAWGLLDGKHPFWNEKQKDWLDRYSDLGLGGFIEAGMLLLESGKFEETSIAIRFVAKQRDAFNAKTFTGLAGWFRAGILNWAHTDVLCAEVIGPLLAGGRVRLRALDTWRRSEFKYQRRAVPVAMLNLLKAGAGASELLEFIRPMTLDSERVVHQGLGWFLRETWKKHPRPVEAFLREYKDTAARLIFQYATEKMTPAQRERFRARQQLKRRAATR